MKSDGAVFLSRNFSSYGETDSESYTVGSQVASRWQADSRSSTGRILTKTETVGGTAAVYAYSYDDMGRLLTVTKNSALVEEYHYDAAGTRNYEMNTLRGITGKTLSYDADDRLLTAGTTTYQYDADGFLKNRTGSGGTTLYNYSSRGELRSVTLPDTRIIEYVHDPLGRRIAKKINGAIVEKYLWQGMTRLLAVYDGNNALLMRFEYADARMPFAMMMGSTTYFLTYDQVGSLRVVANDSGTVIKQIEYDSFGNVISDSDPAFTVPFGFAGGLHDKDTKLVRFGYRDYDPDTGRWTAKDPIGFGGRDTDLYGYCVNDPVNWVDSDGLVRGIHTDTLGDGGKAIHYDKYRFNQDGQLVDHAGRPLDKPEKGGTWKEAQKILKWLMAKKPGFFRAIPLSIWFEVYDKALENIERGLPADYDLVDDSGCPNG